jgi:hypothetical protein
MYDREKFCILEKNAFILHPLLPDRLMAGQLILVQFVLVRIQLGQRKKSLQFGRLFLFENKFCSCFGFLVILKPISLSDFLDFHTILL